MKVERWLFKLIGCLAMVGACLVWTYWFGQVGIGQIWLVGAIIAALTP